MLPGFFGRKSGISEFAYGYTSSEQSRPTTSGSKPATPPVTGKHAGKKVTLGKSVRSSAAADGAPHQQK
eukprot:1581385-Pyramimonas_sp.AAC.1